MKSCKFVQNNLSAYIDRELPASEVLQIKQHIRDCNACAAEEKDLRALKAILGGISAPEPAADFEQRLLKAVRTHDQVPVGNRYSIHRSFVLFAGVAAVTMFVTLTLLNPSNQKATASSTPAQQTQASNIALEIQRDQMVSVAADPMSGMPMMSTANYGH